MVSQAECGSARLGERYLSAVLEACGLAGACVTATSRAMDAGNESKSARDELSAKDELSPAERAEEDERVWRKQAQRDWYRTDIAGIDPETFLLVRIGSTRDRELREKFASWSNRLDPLDDG